MSVGVELLAHPELASEIEVSRQFRGVIGGLRNHELYEPEAPMTSYLRGRLALLSGDEYQVPPLFVAKGEELNAFATDDAIIVYDGVFKKLEHEEEIDALLGHEMMHVVHGHTCRQYDLGRPVEGLGQIRTQEIEADVRTIELLDRRGINPTGLISLLDKLARPEDGKKMPKYHSPTHGAAFDRKVTIEQALSIVDAKNLAPGLTRLPSLDTGDQIRVSSPAFPGLPAPVRQAVLSNATRNVVTQRQLEAQRQIIRDMATEPQPEELVDLKARLILHGSDPKRMPELEGAGGANGLISVLKSIDSPELQELEGSYERRLLRQEAVEQAASNLLLADTTTSEDIHRLAEVIRDFKIIYNFTRTSGRNISSNASGLFLPKLKDAITPDNYQRVVGQLAELAALTYTTSDEISLVLSSALEEENVTAVGGVDSETFLRDLYSRFDASRLKEAMSQNTGIKKLLYAAEHLAATEDPRNYLTWGFGKRVFSPAFKEMLEESRTMPAGPFASVLKKEIRALSVPRLVNSLARHLQATGDVRTVQAAATLALEQLNFKYGNEYTPEKQQGNPNLDALLPLIMMTGSGRVGDNSSQDHILLYLAEEGYSGRSLKNTAEALVNKLERVRKIHRQLTDLHPDIVDWSMDKLVKGSEELQDGLLVCALNDFMKTDDPAELITLMRHSMLRRISPSSFYEKPEQLAEAKDLWSEAAERLFARPEYLETEEGLLTLAALGLSAAEVELNLNIAGRAFEIIARKRDFEGCMRLVQDEFPHLTAVHGHVLTVLIEEKARSREQFEQLESLVESMYSQAIDDNLGTLGKATLIDSIVIPFYADKGTSLRQVALKTDVVSGLQHSQLLAGLLSSGHDDSQLKKYVAERWWLLKRTNLAGTSRVDHAVSGYFTVEDYLFKRGEAKRGLLEWWLENDYPRTGSYAPFASNMDSVYLLSAPARFLAVRKILLEGDNAILHDPEGAEELVDALMDSWLKAEDGTEESVITRDLLLNLLLENDTSMSYQHIAPMLQEMILKPPKQPSPIRSIAIAIADTLTERAFALKTRLTPTEADYEHIRTRVYRLFTANQPEIAETGSEEVALKQRMLGFVGAIDAEAATKKLSTIAFAALAGKKSGALGVKMLQLAGQYFDLTPEDKQDFDEVYDDMKGQTRLQAYKVLKREAASNPATRQLLDAIEEFGPRIGGGSLFTVYQVRLTDGRDVALGVKNPNAEYRVAKLAEFAAHGLSATLDKHAGDSTLQLMDALLVDAAKWVHDELKDESFSHKDAVFKAENDTRSGHGFKKGRSKYDLTTPATISNGSSWIRSEEYIEGKNLTGLRIVDDEPTVVKQGIIHRDDFKQVASVIVRNYVHQVLNGSFAHSDIHPGNFRVTENNDSVVVFDRHNLIPMTPELRTTIKNAFQSIAAGNMQDAAFSLADHASGPAGMTPQVREAVAAVCSRFADDPSTLVVNTLVTLKRQGVAVPLELSLLLRNFMSVSQLSAQAGFTNIVEAFAHTTDEEEFNQLAG